MIVIGPFQRFPGSIALGRSSWSRIPERYAVLNDNEETVEFPSGQIHDHQITAAHRPVYRLDSGSRIGAPTGRVYVRFAGVRADARAEEIAAAGYVIRECPAYAPHSAWLSPASGDAADGLSRLDALRRIPDVESIEPQMLSKRSSR